MEIYFKKSQFFLLALSIFFLASCSKDDSGLDQVSNDTIDLRAAATICNADVINPIDGNTVTGTAKLVRTSSKVSMNMKVDNLIPGHAYTVWWVIWNLPENCLVENACTDADFADPSGPEVEVLYAAGHVVGGSGKGNFAASLNENDSVGTINPDFGIPLFGGLANAQAAEVHLVLRSHGPKIPGQVAEQIGTYGGGCTDFYGFPPFTEIPDEEGECGDIFFAIFSPDCGG